MPSPSSAPSWIADLNRGVRSSRARWRYGGRIPFGEALAIERFVLGNGLTALILADDSAPVVAHHSWFEVGSRHEEEGKTGLAHFFEHLMFNETEGLAYGEFDRLMEAAGAETNAATWCDWTTYHQSLPKEELSLSIRLEAQRMSKLVLRKAQVETERGVVLAERRDRVDDDVAGEADELLTAEVLGETHPYGWPTIGWQRDIEGYTVKDCRSFYRRFYAPNRATLVIVGDVSTRDCLGELREHYGRIKEGPELPLPAPRAPKKRRKEKRLSIHRPTPTEKLVIGYPAPGYAHRDHLALSLIDTILTGGRSARLYRRLVLEEEKATSVRASIAPFRYASIFDLWASARPGQGCEPILEVVDEELGRVLTEKVSEEELETAKNKIELATLSPLESVAGKAEAIGFGALVTEDPAHTFARLDRIRALGPADLLRAARAHLDPKRRVVLSVLPQEGTAEELTDEVEQ